MICMFVHICIYVYMYIYIVKSPMGLGNSTLKIKIVLESNPLKSTMLVGRLGELRCHPDRMTATSNHNTSFARMLQHTVNPLMIPNRWVVLNLI